MRLDRWCERSETISVGGRPEEWFATLAMADEEWHNLIG
jgi:hypothetical protein